MEVWFNFVSSVCHDGAWFAIQGLLIGTIVTAACWLIWRTANISHAGLGYVVWWGVLITVVAAPFLLGSPIGEWLRSPIQWQAQKGKTYFIEDESATVGAITRQVEPMTFIEVQQISTASTPYVLDHTPPHNSPLPVMSGSPVETAPQPWQPALGVLTRSIPISLLGLWFFVVLVLLIRLIIAHRKLIRIKRDSRPVAAGQYPRVTSAIRVLPADTRVQVRISANIDYPMAAGLGKPIILLPETLATGLTTPELRVIILHEFAHLTRWDDWTKLAQRVIESVLFFNPVIHWIGRRLELEREIACDDHVVRQTGNPGDYARCLTRLSELTALRAAPSLIPGVLNGRKQIFKRFERLLHRDRQDNTAAARWRFAGTVVAMVVVLAVAMRVVPVVALPSSAVTLDEVYDAVEHTSKKVIADVFPGPPSEAPAPDETNEEPLVLASAEPEFLVLQPQPAKEPTVFVKSNNGLAAITEEESEKSEVAENAKDLPPPAKQERLVDWSDERFDFACAGMIKEVCGHDDDLTLWVNDDRKVRVVMRGQLTLIGEEPELQHISPDGWLAVQEKHGRVWRELDVRPVAGGDSFDYTYFVDGELADYAEMEQHRFGRVLRAMRPSLEALAANSTIPGTPSLPVPQSHLDIPAPEVGGLAGLIEQQELTDELVLDILGIVGRMDSDFEKKEILSLLVDYCRGNEDLEDAFSAVGEGMITDSEIKELYAKMYREIYRSGRRAY